MAMDPGLPHQYPASPPRGGCKACWASWFCAPEKHNTSAVDLVSRLAYAKVGERGGSCRATREGGIMTARVARKSCRWVETEVLPADEHATKTANPSCWEGGRCRLPGPVMGMHQSTDHIIERCLGSSEGLGNRRFPRRPRDQTFPRSLRKPVPPFRLHGNVHIRSRFASASLPSPRVKPPTGNTHTQTNHVLSPENTQERWLPLVRAVIRGANGYQRNFLSDKLQHAAASSPRSTGRCRLGSRPPAPAHPRDRAAPATAFACRWPSCRKEANGLKCLQLF